MLIASCLILAVRTAKWAPRESGDTASDRDLEVEVDNALVLVNRLSGALLDPKKINCAKDLTGASPCQREPAAIEVQR
jgi:hypothetical protein